MRRKFSERYGFKKPREAFQIDNIDNGLKNRLWNQFKNYYIDKISVDFGKIIYSQDYNFFKQIYDQFFKIHEEPDLYLSRLKNDLKQVFFQMQWYEIYDFIEYVADIYHNENINSDFKEAVNKVLEEEMSGYRFVGDYIAPIIDKVEIQEIEDVFESPYEPVKRHLSQALELLSDRENPDYQNSIKESITAVEAIAQIITGKRSDLGSCLKAMKLDLNKSFINGLSLLYSWTNKEDGIRHAHTGEELKTSFEEAKYMLVSCSAVINYLIIKYKKKDEKCQKSLLKSKKKL